MHSSHASKSPGTDRDHAETNLAPSSGTFADTVAAAGGLRSRRIRLRWPARPTLAGPSGDAERVPDDSIDPHFLVWSNACTANAGDPLLEPCEARRGSPPAPAGIREQTGFERERQHSRHSSPARCVAVEVDPGRDPPE